MSEKELEKITSHPENWDTMTEKEKDQWAMEATQVTIKHMNETILEAVIKKVLKGNRQMANGVGINLTWIAATICLASFGILSPWIVLFTSAVNGYVAYKCYITYKAGKLVIDEINKENTEE